MPSGPSPAELTSVAFSKGSAGEVSTVPPTSSQNSVGAPSAVAPDAPAWLKLPLKPPSGGARPPAPLVAPLEPHDPRGSAVRPPVAEVPDVSAFAPAPCVVPEAPTDEPGGSSDVDQAAPPSATANAAQKPASLTSATRRGRLDMRSPPEL